MTAKIPLYLQEIAVLTAAKMLTAANKPARRETILAKAKELLEDMPGLDDRTLAFFFSNLIDTGLLVRAGDEFLVTIKASQAVASNLQVFSRVQNAATFGMAL